MAALTLLRSRWSWTAAVNSPPDAVDDLASTTEDTAKTIDVLANDSDPDDDVLSVTSVSTPGNGTAVINPDNTITYTPNAGFSGDSFTYTISDGNGGTDTATVSIAVGNEVPLYVYEISFESKRGNKDWRAVFEIRSDSNADGSGRYSRRRCRRCRDHGGIRRTALLGNDRFRRRLPHELD